MDGMYVDTSFRRRRMVCIGHACSKEWRHFLKSLWLFVMVALFATAFAAERVVLFEEFTQTG